MAIGLGDAVFQFVADTTQLDRAVAEAPAQAEAGLAPVNAQLKGMREGWTAAGVAASKSALEAKSAGETTGRAATQAAEQTNQAANVISGAWFRVAQATRDNAAAQSQLALVQKTIRDNSLQDEEALGALALAQQRAALAAHELSEAQREVALTSAEETVNLREAQGTIALVGEEAGVRVPRHLRRFVAQLPGVGAALEAAFSGVAILILIQLLVEASQKLSEFIGEHFIYTEALKESYAANVALNNALVEQDTKLKALKKTVEDFNLTPLQKADKALKENTTEIQKQAKALEAAKEEAAGYADQLERAAREREAAVAAGDNSIGSIDVAKVQKDAEEVGSTIVRLNAQLKTLREQDLANQLEYDKQAKEEGIASEQAQAKAVADVAKANLDVWRATSRVRLAERKLDYTALAALDSEFAEREYSNERAALGRRLAIAREDPTKNKAAIVGLNAELEVLDREHHARLLNNYASYQTQLRAMLAERIQLESKALTGEDSIYSAEATALRQVEDAFRALGITSSATLAQQAANAQKAYDQVRLGAAQGLVSTVDLLRAEKALLEATVAYHKELGKPQTAEERKRLLDLTTQIKALTGEADKVPRKFDSITSALDRFVRKAREARGAMSDTQQIFDAASSDMATSFGNAVAEFERGQESMGVAIEKALAQYLTSLSAKAAMDALYFTAWGIADSFWAPERAGADFAAAAEFAGLSIATGVAAYALNKATATTSTSATSSSPAAGSASPATQGAPSPKQTTNVQHFARGALVNSPTLAVIGDAVSSTAPALSGPGQREAAIPLDDPEATGAIADALYARMRHQGNVQVNVKGMISPDNLGKVVKKLNRGVRSNQYHLESSSSLRLNKRSQ